MRILAPRNALFAFTLASLSLSQVAPAVDYNYTGPATSNIATPDSWNSGTNWNATPVSGLDTILNLSLTAGANGVSTVGTYMVNDIPGTFQLNQLNSFKHPDAGVNNQRLFLSGNDLEFLNDTLGNGPIISFSPTWNGNRPLPETFVSNDLILTNDTLLQYTAQVFLSGEISGAGMLTVAAPPQGTTTDFTVVTLSNASNSYSGGTTINGGTLQFANTGAMPTTGAITVAASAAASPAALPNLGINVGGAGEFTTATVGAGSIGGVLSSVTFGDGAGLVLDTTNNGGGVSTYAGDITGALRIIKRGANTLELTGNNTFTGTAIGVNGGALQTNFTGGAVTSGLIIEGGNVMLSFIGNKDAVSSNAGGAYNSIFLDTGAGLIYTGTGETTDRVITTYSATSSFTLDQSGASGTLNFTSDFLYGAGNGSGGAPKAITLTGSTAGIGHISGAITDVYSGANVLVNRSNQLIKDGTGTWVLSGANGYSGGTTIRNGVLSVSSIGSSTEGTSNLGGATQTAGTSGAPPLGTFGNVKIGATTTTGTLRYTGTGEVTDRVVDLNGTTGGAVIEQSGATGHLNFTSDMTATGAGTKTLTLQGSTDGTGEISGAIVDNSGVNQTAVAKSGTGTWTLSGENTYSGGTTINEGTLVVNNSTGSATGTGVVLLGAATLAGSGSIDGLVTTSGATSVLAAGNSPGTLTLNGGLDASAGTTFEFELGATSGAPDSDLISMGTGVFTGSSAPGGLVFNFSDAGATTGTPYTLLTFGSSLDFEITDIFTNPLPATLVLDATFGTGGYQLNSDSLQVQFIVVPEPGSMVIALGGLAALAGFRRARRRC